MIETSLKGLVRIKSNAAVCRQSEIVLQRQIHSLQ